MLEPKAGPNGLPNADRKEHFNKLEPFAYEILLPALKAAGQRADRSKKRK
jgi:hypothetical protein